jgi:hypothetical protein
VNDYSKLVGKAPNIIPFNMLNASSSLPDECSICHRRPCVGGEGSTFYRNKTKNSQPYAGLRLKRLTFYRDKPKTVNQNQVTTVKQRNSPVKHANFRV